MLDFLKLLQELRISQKKYARTRKGADLITCNYLSDQIDTQLEPLIREWNKKKFDRVRPSDEVMDVLEWLHGYNDFPERGEKEGAYYWRTHLRNKLSQIGIDIDAYHKSKGK